MLTQILDRKENKPSPKSELRPFLLNRTLWNMSGSCIQSPLLFWSFIWIGFCAKTTQKMKQYIVSTLLLFQIRYSKLSHNSPILTRFSCLSRSLTSSPWMKLRSSASRLSSESLHSPSRLTKTVPPTTRTWTSDVDAATWLRIGKCIRSASEVHHSEAKSVSNASQMHGHDRALRCILQLQPPNAVCLGPSVMSFGSNQELQRGTKSDRPAAGLQPGRRICH